VSSRQRAVSCRHPAATMPLPCHGLGKSLSEKHIRGMAGEGHGMCESNTAALCKSNGKTQSKALAERHGRGTAWEQHGNGRGTAGERHGNSMGTAWEQHGNGMGTEWERHGMCESALRAFAHTPAKLEQSPTPALDAM
jgi:hypothetical protein